MPARGTTRLLATPLLATLLLAAAPSALRAQGIDERPAPSPTCESLGIRRVAVMVPPGQTRDQFRATLAGGALFPAGTEVAILEPQRLPAIVTYERFDDDLQQALRGLLSDGIKVDGALSTLVVVGADGTVREVHPNTRNADVNNRLVLLWRRQRFVPYEVEGCRVAAWIHAPLAFSSEWSVRSRGIGVRVGTERP